MLEAWDVQVPDKCIDIADAMLLAVDHICEQGLDNRDYLVKYFFDWNRQQ